MTTPATAFAALLARLRAPDGTGSYTFDLTDRADRVVEHVGGDFQIVPQALVYIESIREETGRFELTNAAVTMTVRVLAIVNADSDTGAARSAAALALLQDFKLAIRADRTLGGLVIDTVPEGSVTIADSESGDLYGVVDLTITARWQEAAT